jgi:TRAP-type transport system periplasmic protein
MLIRTLAALGVSLALALPAAAAEQWKLTSAAQPGLIRDQLVKIAEKISEQTKGEVKAEFQFIPSEQEAVQQIVRGRIEMGSISMTGLSTLVPEAAVMNTPYVWASSDQADFVIDNYMAKPIGELLDKKGLVLLGFAETGWTDVVGKTPMLSPADAKGKKIRVSPAPASAMFWRQIGVNAVQLPLGELFPGLEQGLVEGADLPFVYYVTTPAAKTAPHYVLTRHLHQFNAIMANKAAWSKLAQPVQAQVRASITPYSELRKAVRDAERPLMAEFEKNGGKVHQLTDAQRAAWRTLVEPGQAAFIESIGGEAKNLFSAIEEGKKAFKPKG